MRCMLLERLRGLHRLLLPPPLLLMLLLLLSTTRPGEARIRHGEPKGGGANLAATLGCIGEGRHLVQKERRVLSNGCGSGGMQVQAGDFDFTDCCDQHDACYDICGAAREVCEERFRSCMIEHCRGSVKDKAKRSTCRRAADTFTAGVEMFAALAFRTSQADACDCITTTASSFPPEVLRRYEEFIRRAYRDARRSADEVDRLTAAAVVRFNRTSGGGRGGAAEEPWRVLLDVVGDAPETIELMRTHPRFSQQRQRQRQRRARDEL